MTDSDTTDPGQKPFQLAPAGALPDKEDDQAMRWGREQHTGFTIGKYVQTPPFFCTVDHHPLWIADMYRGRTCFLICGGPSFANLKHKLLRQPGIITMALNNSVKTFRPNLWCSVDSPDGFIRSIFLDPLITKFVPICHANKQLFNSDTWQPMTTRVRDCPGMIYYRRNEKFQAGQYLWEDTLNWGNHSDVCANCGEKKANKDEKVCRKCGGTDFGARSVMLAAMRILFLLGFRRVFLLGCDFKMDAQTKYHFDQDRSPSSIKGNNHSYALLNERFTALRPLFDAEQFYVVNCNADSGLTAFEYASFKYAVNLAVREFGVDCGKERTRGLYERKSIAAELAKLQKKWNDAHEQAQKESQVVLKCKTNKGRKEHERAAAKWAEKAMEFKAKIDEVEANMKQLKEGGNVNNDADNATDNDATDSE